MSLSEDNLPEVSMSAREQVLQLEATRDKKGYKPGWLYYKCKEAGLLAAHRQLQSENILGDVVQTAHLPQSSNPELRLTIELVPETCWFSNVRSEVSDEDWNKLKKITFQKASYRCEVCGGKGSQWPVECHEIWHYDDHQHIQTLVSLVALCPACHEVKHMGLANIRGRAHIAKEHLAKVNGWTHEQTREYVSTQFEVWRQRSNYNWKLDISWLKQFDVQVIGEGRD
ncbi:hypothetical protein NIES4073_78480 [Kalymmatonema gypsitolerans NIES-4073]|nr:hypothetical protein NIES4073_78480 [Scytonema sp. NIES-4073]